MKGTARITAVTLLVLAGIIPVHIQAAAPGPFQACGTDAVPTCVRTYTIPSEDCLGALLDVWTEPITASRKENASEKEKQNPKKPQKDRIPPKKKQAIKPEEVNSTNVKKIGPAESTQSKITGPLAIFADIEAGWKVGNVQKILQHFGEGKVVISIGGIGPSGGRFSKSQSYYLLKDLFKYTITKKFDFVQYRNLNNGKRKIFAVAERYYKRTDDGRLFKDKIYVSLHQEGDLWVIGEIKSIR